ncbi:uncharacterized protein BJ171DRAFT_515711, partial [Polychytrium aggregatum]|uniref:uncharacterized protein n=1 Tax=Polychytrium aggregatum TaxID=110093 RepID=UPI0022FE5B7F
MSILLKRSNSSALPHTYRSHNSRCTPSPDGHPSPPPTPPLPTPPPLSSLKSRPKPTVSIQKSKSASGLHSKYLSRPAPLVDCILPASLSAGYNENPLTGAFEPIPGWPLPQDGNAPTSALADSLISIPLSEQLRTFSSRLSAHRVSRSNPPLPPRPDKRRSYLWGYGPKRRRDNPDDDDLYGMQRTISCEEIQWIPYDPPESSDGTMCGPFRRRQRGYSLRITNADVSADAQETIIAPGDVDRSLMVSPDNDSKVVSRSSTMHSRATDSPASLASGINRPPTAFSFTESHTEPTPTMLHLEPVQNVNALLKDGYFSSSPIGSPSESLKLDLPYYPADMQSSKGYQQPPISPNPSMHRTLSAPNSNFKGPFKSRRRTTNFSRIMPGSFSSHDSVDLSFPSPVPSTRSSITLADSMPSGGPWPVTPSSTARSLRKYGSLYLANDEIGGPMSAVDVRQIDESLAASMASLPDYHRPYFEKVMLEPVEGTPPESRTAWKTLQKKSSRLLQSAHLLIPNFDGAAATSSSIRETGARDASSSSLSLHHYNSSTDSLPSPSPIQPPRASPLDRRCSLGHLSSRRLVPNSQLEQWRPETQSPVDHGLARDRDRDRDRDPNHSRNHSRNQNRNRELLSPVGTLRSSSSTFMDDHDDGDEIFPLRHQCDGPCFTQGCTYSSPKIIVISQDTSRYDDEDDADDNGDHGDHGDDDAAPTRGRATSRRALDQGSSEVRGFYSERKGLTTMIRGAIQRSRSSKRV